MKKAIYIRIKGLVQGVGFRPFVYRQAIEDKVCGWVENRNDGVHIHAEAPEIELNAFIVNLQQNKPEASIIEQIWFEDTDLQHFTDFTIRASENTSNEITGISPDIATCPECLHDLEHQPHRINYPFTNCTNCGPRFTIIQDLPYDRKQTTMRNFEMCPTCNEEYNNVANRRFHAQPVACNQCGPKYTMHLNELQITDFDEILTTLGKFLDEGKIVALKGMGGYNLVCDALNEDAVARLRKLKLRDKKPFAVMFSECSEIEKFAFISSEEKKQLTAWQRPIVILNLKPEKIPVFEKISGNIPTIGALLPYMPLHYLLFGKTKSKALVFTSGNISDEPIVINDSEALEKFDSLYDAVITHNRDIYNRTDDSVVFVADGSVRTIRRSRGYVPSPLNLPFSANGIIAFGAELTNTFCVGKGTQAILSQHIGDLKNAETLDFYKQSFENYLKLFRIEPRLAVADLHPDYLSTRFAEEFANKFGIELLKIQHHEAHIAACMAENKLTEPVIGVAFDGTGYGTDGKIWGSEFFVGDLHGFKRINHLDYLPLPGGDKVTHETWRQALSVLYQLVGNEALKQDLPFLKEVNPAHIELVLSMLQKNINSPESCGAGRYFDAAAALTNACLFPAYHAEAPVRFEFAADPACELLYPFEISETISLLPTFSEMINDIRNHVPIGIISAKFHNTIAQLIFENLMQISQNTGIKQVCFSGGVFQNRFLLKKIHQKFLIYKKICLNFNANIPVNDAGISLGQLAMAANKQK